MSDTNIKYVLTAAEIGAREQTFSHPWNSQSEITGAMLGRSLGLKRTGVNIGRIPAGKESFVYHSHHCEEEWIYILGGRAIVDINDTEVEVGPGDFVAFPPAVAHHLRNPFSEELRYLFGGENADVEIAEFPRLGKRMVRRGAQIDVYEARAAKPFGPEPPSPVTGPEP
jgi:uncharacterized cupin superfamily protein